MDEKVKQRLLILGALLLLVLVAYIEGNKKGYDMARSEIKEEVRTDTIRKTDTVILPAPPPEVRTKIQIKEVKVPASDVEIDTDVDSARVTLPFEQHFASLGDVADIWFSGYQPRIDSVVLYKHEKTIIEQHYITEKPKPNIVALEAGLMDVSVLYMRQIGSFYVGISAGCTYEGQATAKGVVGFRF